MNGYLKRGIAVLASAVVLGLAGLAGFEAWQVRKAQARVTDVFAPYRASHAANDQDELLTWAHLSEWQKDALIRIEDPNFFTHSGIDFRTPGAGLTTITQAITKRLFFDDFQPGFEKIEQSLITHYVVTPNVEKDVQLTAFLNLVYLGHRNGKAVTGFPEGARAFFGKDFAALSEDEFLRLTGALIAPRTYPPIEGNAASDERLARLRRYMIGNARPHPCWMSSWRAAGHPEPSAQTTRMSNPVPGIAGGGRSSYHSTDGQAEDMSAPGGRHET